MLHFFLLKVVWHASLTFGLYSAFLALRAIVFKSSLQPRFTVDTMFLIAERIRSILRKVIQDLLVSVM